VQAVLPVGLGQRAGDGFRVPGIAVPDDQVAEAVAEPADRYRDILARILSGLLVLLAPRMAECGPDVELFGMVAPGK
jgi:hypothetical protein